MQPRSWSVSLRVLAGALWVLALAACAKSTAPPAAYEQRRLASLPLVAELPASASLSTDDAGGVIVSARTCVAAIHPVGPRDLLDPAAFALSIRTEHAQPALGREETSAEGWFTAFDYVGSRSERVGNFELRTTLAGVAYRCRALAASPLPTTCEERICRSLRAVAAAPTP